MRSHQIVSGIIATATMCVAIDSTQGASLSWDADGNAANGSGGGTGNWNVTATNKVWYDSTAPGADVAWTTGNDAVFGGSAGTVTISGGVNPAKLTVDTDGYSFNNNLTVASPASAADLILINGNTQFNGSLVASFNVNTVIASSKTLTLSGGGTLRRITGGSVSLGGTASVGNIVLNSALTQTGGTASASLSSQTASVGSGATGSWTLSNAAASLNFSNGSALEVGRSSLGNGTLTISAGATSITSGSSLRIGVSNGVGSVSVAGGELTITGTNSTVTIADSGSGNGTLGISGGTANIDSIQFGRTGQTPSGLGTLNVTGGSLYVGSGGIALGSLAANKATINLSGGGTVGARADWSSSMPIALSGSATVKAADSENAPHNISLSGNITGGGTLTKSGGGKLTLTSAGYTGATNVTAGMLEINGTVATSGITVDSGATLQGTGIVTNGVNVNGVASPGGAAIGMFKVGSATFGTGSKLNINLGTSSASDLLAVTGAGTLDISKLTLNLLGVADGSEYVIATYGGALTGEFAQKLNLPSGYDVDYGDRSNGEISLVLVPEPILAAMLPAALLMLGRRSRRKH